MSFKTTQKELLSALSVVREVVAQKNHIPILQMFKFELGYNKITITGSDSQSTVVLELNVIQSEQGHDFLIDAQSLYEALKSFPAGEIEFEITPKKQLSIKTITGVYELPIQSSEDFPSLEKPETFQSFIIAPEKLVDGLAKTIPFVSSDELRASLCGVSVEIVKDCIEFAATDAHRLAYRKHDLSKSDFVGAFLLNRKAAEFMRERARSISYPIEITVGKSHVYFSIDNLQYSSRLIDPKFPAYKNVIPKDNNYALDLSRENLQSALSRVIVFSNQSTATVSLDIKQSGLQLKAEDKEYAKSSVENIACHYQGEDMVIGLNGKFLAELLKSVDKSDISIYLSAPSKAAIIKESADSENMFLIMPTLIKP